jgi:hypothetical protein
MLAKKATGQAVECPVCTVLHGVWKVCHPMLMRCEGARGWDNLLWTWPTFGDRVGPGCIGGEEDAFAEQVEFGAPYICR